MAPDIVSRAKAYPYRIPERSYLLEREGWRDLPVAPSAADVVGRRPVLACGSNQSPEQLARKFTGAGWSPVPVSRVRVFDLDAVYSAHFSRYAAIPATLGHAPGAVSTLFVTWLDKEQQARMHETEALGVNYDFVDLTGVRVEDEAGGALQGVHAYVSRHGCLNRDGKPVPLAAIATDGRLWPAMEEEDVLALARDRIAPEDDLDSFIEETAHCATTRSWRTKALKADSLAFDYPF